MRVSDDDHIEAVGAFLLAWRADAELPEDERAGVAVGAALAALPEPSRPTACEHPEDAREGIGDRFDGADHEWCGLCGARRYKYSQKQRDGSRTMEWYDWVLPARDDTSECTNPACEDCHGGTQRCSLATAARAPERPASLREVWAVLELHEAALRALRNAVAMTSILKRDLDPVLHALDAIEARKAGGG